MDDAALLAAIRGHSLLEGDFLLRSGKRSTYYLDKYRFETVPELLEPIGARLVAKAAELEPDAHRFACPELGAVVLATAASLASGKPFVIVRGKAKEYGTANQLEGAYEPGDRVILIEDVVTSGGAAADAVRALRQAALECRTAICVIDREEGGVDALARLGVRLYPLFRAAEIVSGGASEKPHG